MLPYIDLGLFQLPTYGLMLLVGFLSALALARHRAPRYGLTKDSILDLGTLVILLGLAGGRLLFVVLHWDYFARHPLEIVFNRSDFVFFGGFLSGAATIVGYCRLKRLDVWQVMDAVAPAIALGHAFGRIGCFMLGCCFGGVCNLPWAVRFPSNADSPMFVNPAFAHHVLREGLDAAAAWSLPVHPTQLYESAANFAICGLLLWLSPRRRFVGQIALAYVGLYGAARFTIEFYRGDPGRGAWLSLSTSQWIALAAVLVSVALWWRRMVGARIAGEGAS